MIEKYKIYNAVSIVSIALVISILGGYFISGGFKNFSLKDENITDQQNTQEHMLMAEEQSETAFDHPVFNDQNKTQSTYYVAKIIENKITIMLNNGETEEVLYKLDTNIKNIPDIDREALEKGVIILTKDELSEFEEDYTS